MIETTKSLTKLAICSLPGHYQDELDTVIDKARGILYIALSKCGNSSVKNAIIQSYGASHQPGLSVHEVDTRKIDPNLEYYSSRSIKKIAAKCSPYFVFTVCRNPYERLVSCYMDHIKQKNIMYVRNPLMFKRTGLHKADLSFPDFVDSICNIPDKYSDRHFRSQTSSTFTPRGEPLFSLCLRLENLADQWKSSDINQYYQFPEKTNVNVYQQPADTYLTSTLKQKIYARYTDDFNNFNYAR